MEPEKIFNICLQIEDQSKVKEIYKDVMTNVDKEEINELLASWTIDNEIEKVQIFFEHYPQIPKLNLVKVVEYCYIHEAEEMKNYILNQIIEVNHSDYEGNTYLHMCARYRDVKGIEKLIKQGANINLANKAGKTPLLRAVEFGDKPSIKELLENGADVNKGDHQLYTPLHEAILQHHNIDIIKMLLEKKADPNIPEREGNTPTLLASNRPLDILKLLLQYGGDITATNKKGWNILHRIAALRLEEVVEKACFIINLGVDINHRTQDTQATPLQFAIDSPIHSGWCKDMIELLLNKKADTHVQMGKITWPIHDLLIEKTGLDILRLFKIKRHNFHEENPLGLTCLFAAFTSNNEGIFKFLLGEGVPIYGKNGPIYFNNDNIPDNTAKLLLERFAQLSIKGEITPEIEIDLTCVKNHHPGYYEYYDSCVEELTKMQSIKITSRLSLFDLYKSSLSQLTEYLRDQDLKKTLQEIPPRDFPIFRKKLGEKFKEAQKRADKWVQIEGGLQDFLKNSTDNTLVLREIASYLLDSQDGDNLL